MNKLISLITLVLFTSCKDTTINTPEKVVEVIKEIPVEKEVVVEKEVIVEVEKEHETLFAGYYNLDGPGNNCIYLDEKTPNVVDIESDCQSLTTVNPENDTIGQFPRITATNLNVIDGSIRYTHNLNFTNGHDLEEDVSGDDIVGSRRVDVILENIDGRIKITIKVYQNANNSNLNQIVAERVFNEL